MGEMYGLDSGFNRCIRKYHICFNINYLDWKRRKNIQKISEECKMSWIQVLTIAFANIGWCTTMFLWLRKEANADRKELANLLYDTQKALSAYHGRLCAIEERNKR